jgi:glycosyltransferase involved in cell wall biosynthesis
LVSTPYGPEHLAEPGISPARLRGAQAADYVTAKLARRFRAVSGSVKEAYATRLRLKPDLIEVIPGGRNPDRLGRPSPARRQAERAKLGIDDGVAHVVAVGRQEPAKGLDVLLRAIPNVQTASRPLLVSVAGAEGRSSEELGRLTAQLGLQESVQFLGFRRDVPDLLCAADAFVMPSFREGLPGAVVEAMALEIPIVASDIAGTREALGPAAPAELFQPGDSAGLAQALTAVLAGGPIVAERVRAAHSRFDDEYHIDAVASRLIQFFEAARQPPDKRRRRSLR